MTFVRSANVISRTHVYNINGETKRGALPSQKQIRLAGDRSVILAPGNVGSIFLTGLSEVRRAVLSLWWEMMYTLADHTGILAVEINN